MPNIKYDTEWREQKLNKTYLEELNKYREEILNEGLQVEEEGLTGEYNTSLIRQYFFVDAYETEKFCIVETIIIYFFLSLHLHTTITYVSEILLYQIFIFIFYIVCVYFYKFIILFIFVRC